MSDVPSKRRSHPIRLIVLMLSGVLLGLVAAVLDTNLNDRRDFWTQSAPWGQATAGALAGLWIDLFLRAIAPPRETTRAKPLE